VPASACRDCESSDVATASTWRKLRPSIAFICTSGSAATTRSERRISRSEAAPSFGAYTAPSFSFAFCRSCIAMATSDMD
jgi:hypothetical protein